MEFEQVKNYVPGDDYRTINWKATARRGDLMVNSYTDEKSQHVYCIIDKSRAMKMPFEGLSLLDYAINASLVLSNIALLKEDKAGLITVAEKIGAVIPAERRPTQINKILEVLYKEKTRYPRNQPRSALQHCAQCDQTAQPGDFLHQFRKLVGPAAPAAFFKAHCQIPPAIGGIL